MGCQCRLQRYGWFKLLEDAAADRRGVSDIPFALAVTSVSSWSKAGEHPKMCLKNWEKETKGSVSIWIHELEPFHGHVVNRAVTMKGAWFHSII